MEKKVQNKNNKSNFFKNIWNTIKYKYYKNFKNSKTKYNMHETVIFMLLTFSFGIFVGGLIMYGRGPFSSSTSLNEFVATYNEISTSYYKEINDDELLKAGIKGMVGYLGDPYAVYMDSEEAASFNEDVEGVYQGIGAEIKYNDKKEVVLGRIFDDSPAFKAGLKTDDILIKVNNELIEGKSLSSIADIVKGEAGTEVSVTVIRDQEEREFKIKRGSVDSISVTGELIEKDDKKIGYLQISIFAANTYNQFVKELKKLEEDNIDSLIIDVRGNQGGYLTTVTDIISLFIKKGEPIYQLKTKENIEIIKDKTDEARDYEIVILADSASASASEVLAGAMQETYKAKVVGTATFGKGKVQKVTTLSNGSLVKYTYQEWLTPLGNFIDKKGITPDVEIKYVYDEKIDNQKDKAIEVLLNK